MKVEKFFKTLFSNFKLHKKRFVLAVLFCAALILIPFQCGAQGGLGGMIGGAIAGAIAGVVGFALNIIGSVLGAILGLVGELLKWVISPGFISLSYTNPAGNEFIRVGWTLTRDLTNIIFVIALIAIGLGTALRIGDYQAKKALPTLIIIALLINFTPIICGLIVDASNIVMNFFLKGVVGLDAFASMINAQWSGWISGWKGFWNPVGSNPAIEAAAGSLAIIFYEIAAIFLLLLYASIFVIRYIVIWTLVILSPFAFACYILPATRGVFSQWWKQFIQWSIIGIVMAFFLYLSNHMINIIMKPGSGVVSQMAGVSPTLGGLMNQVLPWGIVLVFLFLGLFLGLSTSAMGAGQIMRVGTAVGAAAGTATWKGKKVPAEMAKWAGGRTKALWGAMPTPIRETPGKIGRTLTAVGEKIVPPAFRAKVKSFAGAASAGLGKAWKPVAGAIDWEGIKRGTKSAWEGEINKGDAAKISAREKEISGLNEEISSSKSPLIATDLRGKELDRLNKEIAEIRSKAKRVGGLRQVAKEFAKASWAAAWKEIGKGAKIPTPKGEKEMGELAKLKKRIKGLEEKGET